MTTFSVELVPKDPLWKLDVAGWLAEELGFHGLWLSEHPHNRSSPIVAAHLLRRLRRVWVGLGVLNPYLFNPLTMAQLAATLTEIAPGRVFLGVGAGDKTSLESAGLRRERPLERVGVAVEAVRSLLERGWFRGAGIDARLGFKPRAKVPIYVGAQGAGMLRLAGRLGDGVLVNHSGLEELRWALSEVRRGAVETGRPLPELAAYLTVSISDDLGKALKTAAPYAAYILCGASKSLLDRIGVEAERLEEVREVVRRGDWLRLYEILPEEWVRRVAAVGRPGDLRELVEEVIGLGYGQVVFGAPLGPRVLRALREVGRIARELRENLS